MSVDIRVPRVNVMDPSDKDRLLEIVRAERAGFYGLVDQAGEAGWEAETPCAGWQVRELVGHMVDVTEAYLERFALAGQRPLQEPGLHQRGIAVQGLRKQDVHREHRALRGDPDVADGSRPATREERQAVQPMQQRANGSGGAAHGGRIHPRG